MSYVNGVLTAILRPAHDPVKVFTVQQNLADGTTSTLPFVVAAQIPGGAGPVDPRFKPGRAQVQVDGYASGSREAQDLCQSSIDALVTAWRGHTLTDDGRVAGVGDIAGPYPLPVQASGAYRYTATLQITVR